MIRRATAQDLEAVLAHLRAHEQEAMFCLGNLDRAGLVDDGTSGSGTWWMVEEHGAVRGIVQHAWNGMLILVAGAHAAELARAAMATTERGLAGVVGPAVEVAAARDALGLPEARIRLHRDEVLYALVLEQLVGAADALERRVSVQPAARAHLETLAQWHAAYQVESIGAEASPDLVTRSRARMEGRLGDFDLRVLTPRPIPVPDEAPLPPVLAMTAFNAIAPEAIQVGGVYTPPALRGRGYAGAVVAGHLAEARARGARRAYLFTPEDNRPARHCYESRGFTAVGRYAILLLDSP